jgi:hypothetical protein
MTGTHPVTCTTCGGLPMLGALDGRAAELFATLGPTGQAPQPWMFSDPPTADSWTTELGGQTRIAVGPGDALGVVRDAGAAALGRAE